MDQSHTLAVSRTEYLNRLRSKCYLGQKHDDSLALCQNVIYELDHNAGLSASRDAVEQCRPRLA